MMYKAKVVVLYTNSQSDCLWNYGWVDWDGIDNEELHCIAKDYGKSEEKNLQEIVDNTIKVQHAIVVGTFDILEGKYNCGSCDCYFEKRDDGCCPFCGSAKVAEGLWLDTGIH